MNSNKLKVLFIITKSDLGGAQRFVINLNRIINKDRFQTIVAAGPEGGFQLFENLKGVTNCMPISNLRRNVNFYNDIRAIWEIIKAIKSHRPDIVFLISSKAGALGTIASQICRTLLDTPHVLIYRIDWSFNDPRSRMEKFLFSKIENFLSNFRHIIVQNDSYNLNTAVKEKIRPRMGFKVIHNGLPENIDFIARNEARLFILSKIKLNRDDAPLFIGSIGNFYKTKGHIYFIKALANLKQKHSFVGVLIGDGPQRNEIESEIKKQGLQKTIFILGNIPEAYRLLKGLDLFVLPSVKEGLPWALLEAMSAGVPVVATKVGGIPEVIRPGVDGLLVEPERFEEITDALDYLITNPQKTKEISREAASRVNKEFSLSRMVGEYEELFLEVYKNK